MLKISHFRSALIFWHNFATKTNTADKIWILMEITHIPGNLIQVDCQSWYSLVKLETNWKKLRQVEKRWDLKHEIFDRREMKSWSKLEANTWRTLGEEMQSWRKMKKDETKVEILKVETKTEKFGPPWIRILRLQSNEVLEVLIFHRQNGNYSSHLKAEKNYAPYELPGDQKILHLKTGGQLFFLHVIQYFAMNFRRISEGQMLDVNGE